MDIGESLVGAYMREIRGCHSVAFNTHVTNQAELDVIGVSNGSGGVCVWLAEVAVHLEGLNYGGYQRTASKVAQKIAAARSYADQVYPTATRHFEFWSPVVPAGLVALLQQIEVDLVINAAFTDRVNELAASAAGHTRLTGDDAFRFLQLLGRLRGARPTFATPEASSTHAAFTGIPGTSTSTA